MVEYNLFHSGYLNIYEINEGLLQFDMSLLRSGTNP